ncbi:DUF6691 family protein [Bosea sp. 2KB_26]|uniref:DUF6691 family protein n=1 Tax=Bosea sp. 2KB_26 TaxID=3237475 RepID=UPI003F92D80C
MPRALNPACLAFVLGGAVLVALAGMPVRRRPRRPAFDDGVQLPAATPVDARLTLGLVGGAEEAIDTRPGRTRDR